MVVGLAAASIFPWDAHFSVHLLGLICLVIGDLAGFSMRFFDGCFRCFFFMVFAPFV